MAKIVFEGVRKTFGDFTALDGIDLEIQSGEFLVVVGPSGCGKSTLLDLLGGLSAPTAGRILLDGKPVTGPGLDRGIVFQQYALLPWRTALGNVEFGLEATGVPRRERKSRAREFLDLVGLTGFEDRHPHQLSGGMRQRVAIARSLAYDPDVLLMDEPFAALDAQTRESLQDELRRIWQRTGKTVVFITHGIEEAVYLGQKVAVMTSRPGRIKEIVPVSFGERPGAGTGTGTGTSTGNGNGLGTGTGPVSGTGPQGEELRSSPEFARYRHEIWTLLHDEVARAQQLEKEEASV
ncbi:ABC transporter ATP-binding protein [Streptomyces erythrochromogenes]|uniref:ABC transporter ATP-binding protein n=1 Tax=Streptomyces erythrochromogenes TaxID=285574 RepID=UPI003819CC72